MCAGAGRRHNLLGSFAGDSIVHSGPTTSQMTSTVVRPAIQPGWLQRTSVRSGVPTTNASNAIVAQEVAQAIRHLAHSRHS